MPEPIEVRKVPLHSVSDASELARLIDEGLMEADRVIAVIGKTEGNGGVNDYTRILADRAFREVLTAKGSRSAEEVRQIPICTTVTGRVGTTIRVPSHASTLPLKSAFRQADVTASGLRS